MISWLSVLSGAKQQTGSLTEYVIFFLGLLKSVKLKLLQDTAPDSYDRIRQAGYVNSAVIPVIHILMSERGCGQTGFLPK